MPSQKILQNGRLWLANLTYINRIIQVHHLMLTVKPNERFFRNYKSKHLTLGSRLFLSFPDGTVPVGGIKVSTKISCFYVFFRKFWWQYLSMNGLYSNFAFGFLAAELHFGFDETGYGFFLPKSLARIVCSAQSAYLMRLMRSDWLLDSMRYFVKKVFVLM